MKTLNKKSVGVSEQKETSKKIKKKKSWNFTYHCPKCGIRLNPLPYGVLFCWKCEQEFICKGSKIIKREIIDYTL